MSMLRALKSRASFLLSSPLLPAREKKNRNKKKKKRPCARQL